MTEADVENGVVLYIASPPDSVQGDNDSAPGSNGKKAFYPYSAWVGGCREAFWF